MDKGFINSFTENINELVKTRLKNAHFSLPGKIEKYDATKQRADILILIKQKFKIDDEIVEQEIVIPDVPVVFPASENDVFMSFPIVAGTLGEVCFSDMSLDSWIEGDGTKALSTASNRSHDYSDAFFYPGLRPFSQPADGQEENKIVIRNKDLKMSLKNDGKLKVENSTDEIITVLSDLVNELINALVVTGIGSQPFVPTTVTNLTNIKARLDTFKE